MKNSWIEVADCWDEVNTAEWIELLDLRHQLMTIPAMTVDDVRRMMAKFMLKENGIGMYVFMREDRYLLLVDELAGRLEWMIRVDEETGEVVIPLDTTRQLLRSVGGLVGPSSHGADMTFGEFHAAVTVMNDYTVHHDEYALIALCSILYREKDKSGRRVPLREEDMPYMMHRGERMAEWLRWGVYAWFAHFCEYLRRGTFRIMDAEVCFAPLFARLDDGGDEGTASDSDGLGLNGVLMSVAESGVFGNAEEVNQTPLLKVLMKLLKDYHAMMDMKELSKRNKLV